ncbi:response regulator transcription factor [Clostridium sp. BNL1100]|uniref:response regulator transcription factor n=1 Tax=Clostridium sp. BNL1100 TaxID=755731 RepID=UPI00024A789D|nr:response regulator transcription factor [Clostridium sp. BNL1100]AEY64361.1 response regulator with CheY-like receiver domain and winged-helix DNA-binding domain [Clostridium sp. BNL1100]
MNILLFEDRIPSADSLVHTFKKNHHTVFYTDSIRDGLYLAATGVYDIIILDTLEHTADGVVLVKDIRNLGLTLPIFLLSAQSDVTCKVIALDSGADDYLVKPFSTEELLARVRALGRRKNSILLNNTLCYGDITLDTYSLKISTKSAETKLTCQECNILEFLIIRKCVITSKDMIIEKIWGFDSDAHGNHVEVYISFIRKKLKSLNSKVLINTIRRLGYKLDIKSKQQ